MNLLYMYTYMKMCVYGNKRSSKVANSANYYPSLNDLDVNTLASPVTNKPVWKVSEKGLRGQINLFIIAHLLTG